MNHQGPDHVMALLGYAMDGFRRELVPRMQASAPEGRAPLRPSQIRLLSLAPREGMRVTDLADRLGMTKQSLGELATVLERDGMLESVRDPGDRRVRILRPTAAGLAAVVEGERVIAEVEAEWRTRVGADRWDLLRDILGDVALLHRSSEGHPAS
jgi:DNA-binding MarR family transcriptional regulator